VTDTSVTIAVAAVADAEPSTLTAIGLGSCIGVVLLDPRTGVVGMAHVYLPKTPEGRTSSPAKFADTAVEHLQQMVVAKGAAPHRLRAVIAGGACMFGKSGPTSQIGPNNHAEVTAQLRRLRIKLAADAIGGTSGRTLRVHAGTCQMQCWQTGQPAQTLFEPGLDTALDRRPA
jgi:chemotaxis protein CheD